MERRSPTLEGFRLMFGQPEFGLTEMAWRWSMGFAACFLGVFSFFEFLDTLPVTRGDLLLFRTKQPALVAKALARILRGSGDRLVTTCILLAVCLTVAWIVVSALGRAATLKSLFEYFRSVAGPQPPQELGTYNARSISGLNFFRAVALFSAGVACLAPLAFGNMARSEDPVLTFLLFATVTTLVYVAWSTMNWFLSVASLFVVRDGEDTFGAITAAVDLCKTRPGPVFAVGAWFGLARLGLFTIATFLAMMSVGLLGALPARLVLLSVVCISLLYFGVADFLYIGRMAAYVAVVEIPESLSATVAQAPVISPPPDFVQRVRAATVESVDPDELILSDVPPPA